MKVRFFYTVLTLTLITMGCLVYGFFIEPKRLIIKNVEISSKNYRGQPLKIVFLTDIHIGGFHTPPERIAAIITKANEIKADIILIGGDFINGHTPRWDSTAEFNLKIERGLESIGKLRAKKGVYTVIGNHDNWYDRAYIATKLKGAGLFVLQNESIRHDNLCVIGIADFHTGQPNANGYNDCSNDSNKIVVTHSPDSFVFLRSDTSLALAGHTHGGQINLPILGRRVTKTRVGKDMAYGLKKVGPTPVFVSAGIGTSLLPARFRAPPEIVVITLSEQ